MIQMTEILIAALVFVCLTAASLGVLLSQGKLPAHHRHDDTQNVVRLVANIFVVMTSLVLGLMINTAKSRFDGVNRDLHVFATNLIVLDRTLRSYGAEANDTRQRLLAYVTRAGDGTWTAGDPVRTSDPTSEQLLNSVGESLAALKPADDSRQFAWRDARDQYRKVLELRWALVEQAERSIPAPLLTLVIAWLVLVFGSFGFRAPQNAVVVTCFVLASALISGALYLIVDMDEPFKGPIQISSAPLQRVLAEIRK
jgi:hypothetical protein